MPLSAQTQAVLLLTAHLPKSGKGEPRPLSPSEWGRFALWLKDHTCGPESLLTDDPPGLLAGWLDKTVSLHRIEALLGRGGALGLALEKWERAGLWVMTRSDPDYPDRFKKRLRADAPPLLFGSGNRKLLGDGGLAVVGSRDAGEGDLSFAATLGLETSSHAMPIVSGGARGIDEAAMLSALEHQGTAIGVLADSLLRAATSAKYRKHLMVNNLVLVSPFNPEAGFDVGNAMARNRYIYCLADAAIVVSSTRDKGGTWTGAVENLKEGWVPLWVKPGCEEGSGNAELVRRGARWLPDGKQDFSALISAAQGVVSGTPEPESLLLDLPAVVTAQRKEAGTEVRSAAATEETQDSAAVNEVQSLQPERYAETLSFYDFFLLRLKNLAEGSPLTVEQLQDRLDLAKPQLGVWLKRAISEGQIKKLSKPVRYRWQGTRLQQPSMFRDDNLAGVQCNWEAED
jgi:predicted Rossmann fold nucleotide-binding protein DprA/Smf involved in DNA uptake